MVEAITSHPAYFARHGAILTSTGQRLSVSGAQDLQRFFMDDIAEVEGRFGVTDPVTADALQSRNLRLVRELRAAIRDARSFDPKPDVTLPLAASA